MPRNARGIYKSGFFHIMIQGINKSYIFKTSNLKNKYLEIMKKYKLQYRIKIVAYCIMDNHVHLIIYTDDIFEISKYMKSVNTSYGIYYNKLNKRVGFLFRNRFKSQYIDNNEYLIRCIKYIHMNPVKANIVSNENKYKYSSYKEYFGEKNELVNREILELIFEDINQIHLKLDAANHEIEIMDIDREEENFKVAVKDYLNNKNITLEEIMKDKDNLIKFCLYLKEKKYKQIQIAKLLKIPVTTLSGKIKKENLNF